MKDITLNDIKLFAGIYTMEHENLSKKDKLQILGFIKEANESEVTYLLKNGEMKKGVNISEVDVGEAFGKLIISLSKGEVMVAGGAAAAAIIWLAYKTAKSAFSPSQCKDYKTGSGLYRKCVIQGKITKEKSKLSVISAKKGLCSNSKQPDKCSAKLVKKAAQITSKIQELVAKQKAITGA